MGMQTWVDTMQSGLADFIELHAGTIVEEAVAFAVGQLMWGIAMPVAGGIADRYGQRPVMLAGALASARLGGIPTAFARWFVGRYKVNMAEAANPDIASYATFNDFFTRALQPGARPLASARQARPAGVRPVPRRCRGPPPAPCDQVAATPACVCGRGRSRREGPQSQLRRLLLFAAPARCDPAPHAL